MPKIKDLQEARECFRALLAQRTTEKDWQKFFSRYPFVLSRALPIRVSSSNIFPRGRPGTSEPDFIFYQDSWGKIFSYGVIELKRPDSQILTIKRKNIIQLSGDANTAVRQASQYVRSVPNDLLILEEKAVFLGNESYLFVIMGLQQEILKKTAKDFLRLQMLDLLPFNCQILPYDEVLNRFESTLPHSGLITLVPIILPDKEVKSVSEQELQERMLKESRVDSIYFEELVNRYKHRLFTYVFRLTKNRMDTEDLLQDIFLKAYINISKLKEKKNLEVWLYRLAKNEAINKLTKPKL